MKSEGYLDAKLQQDNTQSKEQAQYRKLTREAEDINTEQKTPSSELYLILIFNYAVSLPVVPLRMRISLALAGSLFSNRMR